MSEQVESVEMKLSICRACNHVVECNGIRGSLGCRSSGPFDYKTVEVHIRRVSDVDPFAGPTCYRCGSQQRMKVSSVEYDEREERYEARSFTQADKREFERIQLGHHPNSRIFWICPQCVKAAIAALDALAKRERIL